MAVVLNVAGIEGNFSRRFEPVGYFRVLVVDYGWLCFYGKGHPILKASNTLAMTAILRLWPAEVTQHCFRGEDGRVLVINQKIGVSLEYNSVTREMRLEPQSVSVVAPTESPATRLSLEVLAGLS